MSLFQQMELMARNFVAKGEALGVFEFWFNRYQALLAVGGAIIAAYLAARPVWAQLEEIRQQSAQTRYHALRRRSEQLQRETTLLQGMASAVQIAFGVMVQLSNDVTATIVEPLHKAQVEGAESHLAQSIIAFRDGIGPAWGNAATQQSRRDLLDQSFRSSSRFVLFQRDFQLGMPLHSPLLKTAAQELEPLYQSVQEQGQIFSDAIESERVRIAPLIAHLESKILAG